MFGTLHAGTVAQSIGRILGLFPPDKVHSPGAEPEGGLTGLSATPKYAYRVAEDSDTTNDYSDQHLYLSTAEDAPIGDGWLLRWDAAP